jgi:hypothetical protein
MSISETFQIFISHGVKYEFSSFYIYVLFTIYIQITHAVDLTEATLVTTIVVGRLMNSPGDISRHVKSYSDVEVKLLVAPCPSANLSVIFLHRLKMKDIRYELKKLVNSLYNTSDDDYELRKSRKEGDSSPFITPRKFEKSFAHSYEYKDLKIVWTMEEIDHFMTNGRCVAEMLEDMMSDSNLFLQIYQTYDKNSGLKLSQQKGKGQRFSSYTMDQIFLLSPIFKYYRSRCYVSVLLHIFELFCSLAKSIPRYPNVLGSCTL